METVLRSHAPSVIDDISAGLQLPPSASGVGSALGVSEEEAEREREAANIPWDDVGVGSGGALLVHGPPGVGKTLLVRERPERGVQASTSIFVVGHVTVQLVVNYKLPAGPGP